MALEDDLRRLARVPLFKELETDALRLVAFSAELRSLRAGDVLFRAGDATVGGYFILSGSISLTDYSVDGGARVLGPDCLIGERALVVPLKRAGTAVAREACSVLQISRATFHRVMNEFPRSAVRVRTFLASRLIAFSRELAAIDLAAADTPADPPAP